MMLLIYPTATSLAPSYWTIDSAVWSRLTNIAILQNSSDAELLMEHDGAEGWQLSKAGHNYDKELGFFLAMTTKDASTRRLMTIFVRRPTVTSRQYEIEFLN